MTTETAESTELSAITDTIDTTDTTEIRPAAVEVHGVHKWYGAHRVLDGVELTVRPGEVTVILGPSGSGKSTLLRVINHLEKPEVGYVSVNGELIGVRRHGERSEAGVRPAAGRGRLKELSERAILGQRSRIGFVFQNFNLFPHLTVLENIIEAPVSALRRPRKQAVETAERLLARVGLGDKASAYPRQLSGGQQQRVAIARALAMRPQVLLLDEVTSALDPELVAGVLDVLRDIAHSTDITMLCVTHEMNFARDISDRVLMFDSGQVIEAGAPEKIFSEPEQPRTREFLSAVL